ncbi:MAG: hypothetical protein LBC71_00630, partial [Oscillospiraceae bacterium]|nr:hypothetical protein [Oscillospiraceae bacterium]
MIKSAIEKQALGNEEQKKLAIYSENELLFTVESICIGYDMFVSRLQKEGIEITQISGIQVSTTDPVKAHAKADKKARKKQKDAEDWADFEEQYPEKAKQHVKTCKILNGIGVAYYFSSFLVQLFNIFSPISTTMFSFGAIALFLIAVFYSVINSHIVNNELEISSPKPSLVNALLAPGLFLGLTALTLYPIAYNFRTWMVFLTVAVIISFILLFVARERGIKKSTLISLLVYVF